MIENAHFLHKICCFSAISMPWTTEKNGIQTVKTVSKGKYCTIFSLSSLASVHLAALNDIEYIVTHDIRAEACHFEMNLKWVFVVAVVLLFCDKVTSVKLKNSLYKYKKRERARCWWKYEINGISRDRFVSAMSSISTLHLHQGKKINGINPRSWYISPGKLS